MANERRLIDATEAETWARDHILDANERYTILDFLRECSTVDAVEVVRCRDCKFYQTDHWCTRVALGVMYESDFCSYGEKREVE